MKLSEFDNAKMAAEQALSDKFDRIEVLRDERRDFGTMLFDIDNGEDADVTTASIGQYLPVREAVKPHVRAAIAQSLAIVEQELVDLGVELDEPAFVPDADEGDEFDSADAGGHPDREEGEAA